MSETAAPVELHPPIERRSYRWVALPLLAFALFSLTAGLLAAHDPRSKGYFRLFFQDPIHLKAGFASAAVALACFQVFSATWIYGKLPWRKPAWINPAHRWSGRLAFVFTLPVAYHCIFKLGFRQPDTRVLLHSLFGCAFYGAFATKVLCVRAKGLPGWALPVIGGRRGLADPIPGGPPDPGAMPEGCRFRPRCPYAADRCLTDPPLRALGPGHSAACHFAPWSEWPAGSSAAVELAP